mmetsp:Transcript_2686/g.7468  ORF Transcript_2686/g.7468 Transcript_2686/m.7468 type:complete len:546 (-) Transcript_2686:284-1921(-)
MTDSATTQQQHRGLSRPAVLAALLLPLWAASIQNCAAFSLAPASTVSRRYNRIQPPTTHLHSALHPDHNSNGSQTNWFDQVVGFLREQHSVAVEAAAKPTTTMGTRAIEAPPSTPPQPSSTTTMPSFEKVKRKGRLPLVKFAELLKAELQQKEWLVQGGTALDASFYHSEFEHYHKDNLHDDIPFMKPSTSLEQYAHRTQHMFDPAVTRAQVIATEINPQRSSSKHNDDDNTTEPHITCTWRLSGKANILWGMDLKPVLVQTDFFIHEPTGLIRKQVDTFSVPHWDVFLSAMFPALTAWGITAPPADPVPEISTAHEEKKSRRSSSERVLMAPVEAWIARAGIMSYFATPEQTHEGDNHDDVAAGTFEIHSTNDHEEEFLSGSTYELVNSFSDASDEAAQQTTTSLDEDALLEAYANSLPSAPTRPITGEEAARLRRADSPLHELLDFFHQQHSQRKETEIRAILSDGTQLPAISAPTWVDKAKLFIPDRPETRESLWEATRRAETRRQERYHYTVDTEEEDSELEFVTVGLDEEAQEEQVKLTY